MKSSILFAILAAALYFYLRSSPPTPVESVVARPLERATTSQTIVVAAIPSYHDRWQTGPNAQTALKTGPNAQTDLKAGPNAQTEFEPFPPSEHAKWNQTPGYSIVSGATLRLK